MVEQRRRSWSTRRWTRRPSCRARWPRRSRSRCSAPTAAATPTPTPRIRSRIPRRSRNFLQMLSIFAIPSALTYYLGRMVKNQRHGWAVWAAMFAMFLAGVLVCWHCEAAGNPIHQQLGVAPADGNMEGKEVRFGIFNSALFATITTDASCGAVNSMHDSFTPLGGLVPLFNIQTRRSHLRRRRRRPLRHADLRRARRLHRRPDGRPHAGISRQENRGLRREDGVARAHRARLRPSSASPPGRASATWGARSGTLSTAQQHRPARLQRNPLRLSAPATGNNGSAFAGLDRQHALVRHHARPRHAHRPLPHDRPDPGARRLSRRARSSSPPAPARFPVSGAARSSCC